MQSPVMHMLQVKIIFRLKFFNLGCFSISFVSQPSLLIFMSQCVETKEIENQPRLLNFNLNIILTGLQRSEHMRWQVAATSLGDRSLCVYMSGDKLQQQVSATDHFVCAGHAATCSNKSWRQLSPCVLVGQLVAATHCCETSQ